MCLFFFLFLAVLLLVLALLFGVYMRYRNVVSADLTQKSYLKMFVFIFVLLSTQLVSLSDVFVNYGFGLQAFLLALPATCSFYFIAYALRNLI